MMLFNMEALIFQSWEFCPVTIRAFSSALLVEAEPWFGRKIRRADTRTRRDLNPETFILEECLFRFIVLFSLISQMPGTAEGPAEQTVGFRIIENGFGHGIKFDLSS